MTTQTHQTLRADKRKWRFDSVIDLLPNLDQPTPLVRLNRVVSGEVFVKLEGFNPFGSVKDRAAAYLLSGLRARGQLEGRSLVEASSGNTAIALAALAALEEIPIIVTIPDGVPEEHKVLLRMLGAEVWPTPDDLCPVDNPKDGAIALARSIAQSEDGGRYAWPDQYSNPDNVRAHYETTGPEIWKQTDGQVRTFVAGYGTCGTITGVGRFLKDQNPSIRIVAVEPLPGHRLAGLKSFQEASVPRILDKAVIDHTVAVDDDSAYDMTKRLFRQEGLMVGPSTGAIVAAAARLDDRGATVCISPDSAGRYSSFFIDRLGDDGLPQV